MRKRQLTYYEVSEKFETCFFWGLVMVLLCGPLLVLGILLVNLDWQVVGWAILSTGIGAIVLAMVFLVYWGRRADKTSYWTSSKEYIQWEERQKDQQEK